ncbi:MAG: hypothetical protein FJZ00_00580 [Candidatus Sericytochromatia bacterium]|uniref:MalT-like TPR region domain-containing protein n=1 Tax=Candidatus Tanganyikabacteria bacterium TaxID=2961651 RepID=A0A937X4T5_9BACT|nr:hypothetical protein [Candidatus Tanganyikabacteria bacterium]
MSRLVAARAGLGEKARAGLFDEARERLLLTANLADVLGEHAYYGQNIPGMFYYYLKAIRAARAAGSFAPASGACSAVAGTLQILGLDRVAAEYFGCARQTADSGALAHADVAEGALLASRGRWDDGERLIRQGWTLAAAINDKVNQGKAAEAFGILDELQNPAKAHGWRSMQLDLARWTGVLLHECWALAGVCAGELERDRPAAATRALEELAARLSRADATTEFRYRSLGAAVKLRNGDPGTAASLADAALAHLQPPNGPSLLAAYGALAETAIALAVARTGGRKAALERARLACKAEKTFAGMFPFAKARHLRHQAALARAEGLAAKARQILGTAVAAARAAGALHDEAAALAELAGLLPDGAEARAHLERAGELRTRLDAEPGRTLMSDALVPA